VQLASGACPTAATPAANQRVLAPPAVNGSASLNIPTPGTVRALLLSCFAVPSGRVSACSNGFSDNASSVLWLHVKARRHGVMNKTCILADAMPGNAMCSGRSTS